tara:strand:- start:2419 stop:2871 length:453 start_codon:yes stop_codon:yes gene_type:complete
MNDKIVLCTNSNEVNHFTFQQAVVYGRVLDYIKEDGINKTCFVRGDESISIDVDWEVITCDTILSKNQAFELMGQGYEVTHDLFTKLEYMKLNMDGCILFEDGNTCSVEDFFKTRNSDYWETGYKLVLINTKNLQAYGRMLRRPTKLDGE